MSSKLIIIRGNSGSGKTTIAREIRNRISDALSDSTMLVQQDIVRRDILRERDMLDKRSATELIELLTEYGRKQGRTVILEGILRADKYGTMLSKLTSKFDEVYVYYFDLPFEETVIRHKSKSNAHEFGEKEMREWWREKDYLGVEGEKIFDETLSEDELVMSVLDDISKGARLKSGAKIDAIRQQS